MFNFFRKGTGKQPENTTEPEWIKTLGETQQRLFTFLDKLEAKMEELTNASIPELRSMKQEDERNFGYLLNGILGQLESVRKKARITYEEKVEGLYDQLRDSIDVLDPCYRRLSDFRTECADRYNNVFDEKYEQYRHQIQSTAENDYEAIYQSILDEHERIKDRFKCLQCGCVIPLTKIYFITTHITCPSCQTKNTFHPSTLASRLEEVGRGLAEQRTRHLLEEYHREQERERALYHQGHQLKLNSIHDQSQALQQQINDIEEQRKKSEARAPQLYREYQRAMFDEWKKLVPDLAEQTENFYQGLQKRNF